MRLMCPNCDAEYEVDASAIPDAGRDVQCSNCGHAWFQGHPETEADLADESALYDPPPPLANEPPSAVDETPQAALPQPDAAHDLADDPEAILDAMAEAEIPEAALPVHEVDAEALRILREEAALETAQRLAEQAPQGIEEQTEMGLSEQANSPIVARRVARLKGIQPVQAPTAVAARDRLPAVDEINNALRNGQDLEPTAAPKQSTGRGAKAGFLTVLLTAISAVGAYVFSPDIAAKVPQAADFMAKYVDMINDLRGKFDGLIAWALSLI
jgi:predicted Zn finger-like uncharacterized protein